MCAYKAMDVADYIVYYCNEIGKKISHLQLQKILYFLEGKYLIQNKSLFKEEIAKWKLGPVVETVYHEYKTFGSGNINYVPKRLEIKLDGSLIYSDFNKDAIKPEDKSKIELIVKKYIDIDPFKLVEESHQHDPWKKDRLKIITGQQGLKYDKDELKHFFIKNPRAFEVN